jgi:NAD(P)-dependent dehydrogenase (short-subunit alcohol dehydrogenase family)
MSAQSSLPQIRDRFDLSGRVAIITGGTGLLGRRHAETVAELGGIPVLFDLDQSRLDETVAALTDRYGGKAIGLTVDITRPDQVETAVTSTLDMFGRIDILINNAANNPKVEAMDGDGQTKSAWSRLENFPLALWEQDLAVGLTGAFLCARTIGAHMAAAGRGVILNIASDLAVIAPDQRLYRQPGLLPDQQPVKPITYSIVKAGLLGLTRYLATYWADRGVRSNALAPGGVENGQDQGFMDRLGALIPLGRMAHPDEYKAAVAFLISDASSYMTGGVLHVDGGRTCW